MIQLALSPKAMSLLAALFTYLLHSTALVAVVWLVSRLLRRHASAANGLWRLALVAPVLSTALALSLPSELQLYRLQLDRPVPSSAASVSHTRSTTPTVWMAPPPAEASSAALPADAPLPPAPSLPDWPLLAAGVLGLVALARLGLYATRLTMFRRGLRARRPLTDARVLDRLQDLLVRSGKSAAGQVPRLSVCTEVLVPMAIGTREICLPQQAVDELAEPELDAVLAHELGHLERGDNRWLTVASVMEAVFFFQPLVALTRRKLQETAELACDERAVELTGSARALARSLAEVAAWNLGGDPAVPVSAMAHRGGLLLRRVETLLAEGGRSGQRRRLGAGAMRLLIGSLAVLAVLLPGVGSGLVGDASDSDRGMLAVATAGAAPGRVTIEPPKATAAANRLRPPSSADPEIDMRPGRRAAGAAGDRDASWSPPASMPRIPMPPLPPPSLMEPVGELVNGVLGGVLPQALSAAGKVGPLAGRAASLNMRVDGMRERQSRGQLSAEERRQLPELERELSRVRRELEATEKKLESDMKVFEKEFERTHGKDFERKMEAWGEEYGRHMEKWGEQFGKEMEKWGEQFGKDMEKWGEAFGRGMEGRGNRGALSRPSPRPLPAPSVAPVPPSAPAAPSSPAAPSTPSSPAAPSAPSSLPSLD